ncbi:MAG: redox-sensing transcriptional repressor Rex [Acidobacteriota bacterium]|nr:redox-sensing transcriptional repressor Rex [Acidobacteriota bacterium]MDH3524313.1 redox-sensing transcriptional repressor Rex [Acidobacteriota bacterium]
MDVSPLTLNRLSIYLRCLRRLRGEGVCQVSSQQFADRFRLSAAQIRKDLATFGEFGIRGVGYEVEPLLRRITELLGLDQRHALAVVGMGSLGSAFARHIGETRGPFVVAAGFDNDPDKVGRTVGGVLVEPVSAIASTVPERDVRIGIVAVPAAAAQEICDQLVAAGIRSVLNFAPVRLATSEGVRTRNVDLRIYLEELVYYLVSPSRSWASEEA